ncbi:CLUMA_CG003379, isoform A [Clunio marinus]|uniref:CLUMA_CG003379, isoform A n=1 Tax=Clunio marinus TaxID=568069 RepID=A0A1J1HNT2_9DIPT|nr:CLUMA_CG003379, isoform A [Clunio marinus]
MNNKVKEVKKELKSLNVTEKPKLNVLCMHGYRQNAEQFKNKIGSFRKFLKPQANFEFINAPHQAKALEEGGEVIEGQCGWWFNQVDGTFNIEQGLGLHGFDESLKCLEETWQQGNYDGILGFSQGGSFLSVVCAMSQKSLTPINPKFIILVSAFKSVSSQHDSFYEEKINIPSLHVSGTSDQVIPHSMHLLLEEAFVDPVIFHHESGHHLPATVDEKPTYKKFFEEQIKRLYPESLK